MSLTSLNVSQLFATPSQGAANLLTLATGGSLSGTAQTPGGALAALQLARENEARDTARLAETPQIKLELSRFREAVQEAESVEELLSNPSVFRILLTANGLEDFANFQGIAEQALTSDLTDAKSVANQLGQTNQAWVTATAAYDFANKGLDVIQSEETLDAIANAFVGLRWREGLDAQTPGLSFALAFEEAAARVDTGLEILGDSVAREVILKAFGIPDEIAFLDEDSQARIVEKRVPIERLKDPEFVDQLAKRYLISVNGGLGVSI